MAQHVTPIAEGLVRVEREADVLLGVDTGIPANSPTLRKLAGQKRQAGHIVHGELVEHWIPKGFIEYDGKVHVTGPFASGRLVSTVLSTGGTERLTALRRIADAFSAVIARGEAVDPIHTRSMVLLDDGGALVLPPDITKAIREHQSYSQRIEGMERYNHPDWPPEKNIGFFLAVASYQIMTGDFPYDANDEEELHARVRMGTVIPASARDVTIRPEVSDLLQRALTSKEAPLDPSGWAERLHTWHKNGFTDRLTEEQRAERQSAASQTVQRVEKTFQRKELVRRNGRKALIIAAIVIVVGSIPGTIIYNALQPRSTAGLPADEVVRVFYTSINTLDHMVMEDAVIDGAGRPLIREVMNLFVLDRQRMSVEMQSGFVDAQQWRDAGMPALQANRVPYGVAFLELTALAAPDAERWFQADFERWLPDYDAAETGGNVIAGYRNREIVRLRQDREDWVIYEFEQISQERLNVRELRQAAAQQ